jgi:hypothetical protein
MTAATTSMSEYELQQKDTREGKRIETTCPDCMCKIAIGSSEKLPNDTELIYIEYQS